MHDEPSAGQAPGLDLKSVLETAARQLRRATGAQGCALLLPPRLPVPSGAALGRGWRWMLPLEGSHESSAPVPDPWPEGSCMAPAAHPEDGFWLLLQGREGPAALALMSPGTEGPSRQELAASGDLAVLCADEGSRIETACLFLQVERAKRQWEATVDGLREGIAVVDTGTGRLLRANWALARQLGTRPDKLVGVDLEEGVLAPLGLDSDGLPPAGHEPAEWEMESRGRSWRAVRYLLEETGAGVVILEDVTERARAHRELVRAHARVQESMERLRSTQAQLVQSEKLAAVGQLVSGVAHELNNPLTSVLGFAQLLQKSDDAEKRGTFLGIIAKEAERARRIVQNLLTFARKKKPEKTRLDLNEVVRQTMELKAYDMKVSGVELRTDLTEDLPPTAGDFQQLQQVLLNLVNNAVHAVLSTGEKGTITVRTRRGPGRVASEGGSCLHLEVEDTGPGIPDDMQSRIFDPFFTTKDVGEGTGLGLAIAYGILQEHGGDIRVEESPEGGARFLLELPEAPGVAIPASVPSEETAPDASVASRRILVVDDEEPIRTMLQEMLEQDGHRVRAVGDGRTALEVLGVGGERQDPEDPEDPFDLILTDLKMPELDGYGLYARIARDAPELADRVVFITGDTVSRETRSFLMKAGNRYLPKPLSLSQLREVVRSVEAASRAAG